MKYIDKLKDPRWQKKRLEIFDRDNWKCVKCATDTISLHVHHKVYYAFKEPWEYKNDLLETLCEVCHKLEHDPIKIIENGGVQCVEQTIKDIPELNKYFCKIGNHKGDWVLHVREYLTPNIYELISVVSILVGYVYFDCHFKVIDVDGQEFDWADVVYKCVKGYEDGEGRAQK